jgi:HrpA-like RNA helicase
MTKEWYQKCKDCGIEFGYSDYALQSDLKKGFSRPERCKDCRERHDKEIKSIASSHFGLIPRKQKRPILGLPYLGHIEHGTRILRDETKEPDPSGMDIGMTPEHMGRIYKALDDYQVLVIVAPTGTGKSTYIPFHLIDPLEGYEKDKFTKHGPIVVTQPRIPAASGIPKAIGDKLMGSHVGPGFEIGYRHGDMSGENKGEVFDRRNRLLFVTDGSLLNWITEGKIGDYSMIIVDEAHERSTNIDLILGLIKQELLKYPHLKLIIASATIDANSFVNYFSEVADTKLLDFADCQKSYGYEEIPWKAKEEDMIERLVDNGDASEVKNKLKSYQEKIIKGVADEVLNILDETDEGGILGFLSGQPEIDKAVELIKDGVKGRKDIKVFPLYTKLGKERIDEAIKEFEESDKTRRVVIATNIAETSLTIPDIIYVVDSGLIKQSEWNPTTCREELKTRFHSKDGCKQRWGRAGRVQKGYAYKLYEKTEFIKYFPLHTSPEITRECLDDVVLRAKASGVQDVDPSKFSWIEKPPEDELNRALSVFNERGLVDQDNDMTEEGREVYRLSNRISRFLDDYGSNSTNRALDVATMLIFADKYACLIEAVTALVMMPRMGNSLYRDEGLLRWDKEWDIQSKDHITRLHKELRVGCIDDLDFACKLFALYEGEISGISDAVLNSWRKRYFINEENFKLIKEAREEILDVFTQGKMTNVLRPIDFSLVERVRLLMAIAWPDRIVSIKKSTPLRFVYSKTNMEGIISENATGNWANQKEAIVAIMDQSDIVINGNKKGAPVANFIIQTPEEIPPKEATDIISKIGKIRKEYNQQKTFSSLYTHLHAPIGAQVNVDSSSKQLKVSDAVLPNVFQPTCDKSLSTKDETDFDSTDLYDHEKHPKSRERRHKKGKSFRYLPLTKKLIESKSNFEIQWANKITGNQAFVENWNDNNGKPIAILNTIDPATDNGESLKGIRTGDKVNLILKRPVFDMLQRKIIIIGFIAENEEGITFPISASNLSIVQDNPGLHHLENQKFDFRFLGVDSLTNYPLFSILPELETDLENLIEKNEVEAYVEKITVENIYFSIKGDKNVIHSAKQPLDRVSEFISDLSVGEKVVLNIEYLVTYMGKVNITVKSTLSSEDVKILEEFGIRVEENQLYCGEPIPYEILRKIQDLLPELSSNLRGLYALSHQLNVYIVEIPKIFRTLQKEAVEIKNIVSVNGDRSRVTEMEEKIKNRKKVRLSYKSRQIINNILNDAWQIGNKMSFLNGLQNELREIPDYQTRKRLNKQLKINQVKREIEELKR